MKYEFEGPDQYKVSFDPAVKETPKKFGTARFRSYLASLVSGIISE